MDIIGEFLIGFIVGYLFIIAYENFDKLLKDPLVRLKGRHIHHSIFGLILIIIFMFYRMPVLLGLAIGIILRHTQAEHKFTFISKK